MASLPKVSWKSLTPRADPKFGTPCARSSHGLSLVLTNSTHRLVILGGENVARTPIEEGAYWMVDFDEDDATSGQWRCLSTTTVSPQPPPRIAHAQAVCESQVYIFGGRAGVAMDEAAMNDLWKLDCSGPPGSEQWTKIDTYQGVPPEPRSFHRMICIDNRLYVFGGCGASGRLADLHQFDLATNTWTDLGASKLRGRGGANLLALAHGTQIGAIAGFAGEETADGHIYDISANCWKDQVLQVTDMRPRSVCVAGSFPSQGYSVIFGGEVDPSDRGHEGAGAFENDLVVLDETTGSLLANLPATTSDPWPPVRGWSAADGTETKEGSGRLYIFGGLAGDDKNPIRLEDLWMLQLEKE